MKQTIIFGAGHQGVTLLRALKSQPRPPHIHCFMDNSPKLQGQVVEGLPVRTPSYLDGLEKNALSVLVTVGRHYHRVRRQLEGYGLEEERHFHNASPRPTPLADMDDRFARLLRTIQRHSVVSQDRLQILHQFARQSLPLAGEMAEVGVYRGGTALLLAELAGDAGKQIHLFDTFSGLPPVDPTIDVHRPGDFSDTGIEQVQKLLRPYSRVYLHAGYFPASVPATLDAATFCFVHIDVDIHRSALDCCEFFHPRLTPGGIMVFDDYGFSSCPGIRKAVDTFFLKRSETPIYLPTGQAVYIKPPTRRHNIPSLEKRTKP
jgi:O-methyltransferase